MITRPDVLQDEYRLRFSKLERYRNQVWRVLCDEYFSRFVSPEAYVLDLGCGWGEFITNVKVAKKYARDLNPDAGRRLYKKIWFKEQ